MDYGDSGRANRSAAAGRTPGASGGSLAALASRLGLAALASPHGLAALASRRLLFALAVLVVLVGGSACRRDMQDQPRYDPLERSRFFEDQRASRPLVAGTIARGHLNEDEHLYTGKIQGVYADRLPFPASRAVLERGRERYDIYCSPCHDRVGTGFGMIVQRGYRRPSSFHVERLRATPVGYFFDVITHGFGAMPSYAAQVPPRDRWAIVAYVRALQLSQHAAVADVPEAERAALGGGE